LKNDHWAVPPATPTCSSFQNAPSHAKGNVGIGTTAQPDSHVGHQQLDQCNASPG